MANWKYFSKIHKFVYEKTRGCIGSRLAGVDMALVIVTGRKSGLERTTPIACYPYRSSIAVSASNNGLDKHPLWYLNLKANPRVTVRFKKEYYKAVAEEVTGEERNRLWNQIIKLNPKQVQHQSHTERVIPLIWFKRSDGHC